MSSLPKVFASGSCRLLYILSDGRKKLNLIHSMPRNFLGKLHNTEQHIQFIEWLTDKIELPDDILSDFFKMYSDKSVSQEILSERKRIIKENFDSCDLYIFEICSLKIYKRDIYSVHFNLTHKYVYSVQSPVELMEGLYNLRSLIPANKPVLFQCHFRPNIIHNAGFIEKREQIYDTLKVFCEAYPNTYMYDPSELLQQHPEYYDGDTHFKCVPTSTNPCFNHLYDEHITKILADQKID